MESKVHAALGDQFDRTIGSMDGLPDTVKTKESTIRAHTPVFGLSQTFIIQTYRQKEAGDTIFIEFVGADGSLRLVLPPVVSNVIARQRDALTGKVRSKTAKAQAQDRKARGVLPGFMRSKVRKS